MNANAITSSARQLLNEEIAHEYASLANGVSLAGRICPRCHGGSSREGSFSITRQDNILLFQCHRAGCDLKGRLTVLGRPAGQPSGGERGGEKLSGQLRYEALGRGRIPEGVRAWLSKKYSLNEYHFSKGGLSWTTEHSSKPGQGRLVIPVADENMNIYGYTARKLDDQHGPKTLSFFENKRGSWYFNPTSMDVIIVEDQLSAIRASKYLNAVALLGTDIPDALLTILRDRAGKILLALDKDAYRKSLKTAMLCASRIKLTPVKVPKDLKDMNEYELIEFLSKQGIRTPL